VSCQGVVPDEDVAPIRAQRLYVEDQLFDRQQQHILQRHKTRGYVRFGKIGTPERLTLNSGGQSDRSQVIRLHS